MPKASESRSGSPGVSKSFMLRQYLESKTVRALKWDAKKEQVIGDTKANELLNELDYRKPWAI